MIGGNTQRFKEADKGKYMQRKNTAVVLYTVLVAGLAIAGTHLYDRYVSAPVLADDIANGLSLTNRCVETSRTGHVLQLQCQAMSLRVTAADYARAVSAWERTGERRDNEPAPAD
jgi:hypothetical protein